MADTSAWHTPPPTSQSPPLYLHAAHDNGLARMKGRAQCVLRPRLLRDEKVSLIVSLWR